MNFGIKRVEDEKELRQLRSFMLAQPQFYPEYREWLDGKCMPRIETGEYSNIIALSDGIVIGDAVYRYLDKNKVELKNFRIDPMYRRRDLGHFLLRQVEFENKGMLITADVTVSNFLGVQFFIRNGFRIVRMEELYRQGQLEYVIEKAA